MNFPASIFSYAFTNFSLFVLVKKWYYSCNFVRNSILKNFHYTYFFIWNYGQAAALKVAYIFKVFGT